MLRQNILPNFAKNVNLKTNNMTRIFQKTDCMEYTDLIIRCSHPKRQGPSPPDNVYDFIQNTFY